MPALRTGSIDDAAERIDELHATIADARVRVREARRALGAVINDADGVFDERDAMTIGELAQALGVRASALRHWEDEGLVTPVRRPSGSRTYGSSSIAQARLVAVLRAGGYRIPAIAQALDLLRMQASTARAELLLDARLGELRQRSIKLLEAAGHLHSFLRDRDQQAEDRSQAS
jgi:DNA-binding transcriptional MerR regulator